jgi:hypothetical protein
MREIILVLLILLPLIGCLPATGLDEKTEPIGVYIYSVTATPTESEQITLKNNFDNIADISEWTLGDENNPSAYNIPHDTILGPYGTHTFPHTTLGFQINDSGETIYLHDNVGNLIDLWWN